MSVKKTLHIFGVCWMFIILIVCSSSDRKESVICQLIVHLVEGLFYSKIRPISADILQSSIYGTSVREVIFYNYRLFWRCAWSALFYSVRFMYAWFPFFLHILELLEFIFDQNQFEPRA